MPNDPLLSSLTLSDIIHNVSSSSSTRQSTEEPSVLPERDVSPELVTPHGIESMRQRVHEMVSKYERNGQLSIMERELADMVSKLTSSLFIDPLQLVRQAEIISSLISQRDYLLHQAEDARQRFESEKDSWVRSAEALIAQRLKPGNSGTREQELERQCSTVQSENRSLRAKLLDTQNRLAFLETELKNLKPLLLLNPGSSSRRSEIAPTIPSPSKGKGKQAQRSMPSETYTTEAHAHLHSSTQEYYLTRPLVSAPGGLPPRTIHSSRHAHSGTSSASSPSSIPGPSSTKKSKPLKSVRKSALGSILPVSSDAKTEHILLAARKIGRERVAAVAGVMRAAEQEKERILREQEAARISKETERLERERLERLANGSAGQGYYRRETVDMVANTPSTSRQTHSQVSLVTSQPVNIGVYPHSTAPPTSFVFVRNSGGSVNNANAGVTGNTSSVNNTISAHEHIQRQFKPTCLQQQLQDSQSSPTPLVSLLSAANMLGDGSGMATKTRASTPPPSGSSSRTRRKSNVVELNNAPSPKRRKVASSSNGKGIGRVRSALDVLADQAAAAFPSEADQVDSTSMAKSASAGRGKGNGAPKESKPGNARNEYDASSAVAPREEATFSTSPIGGRAPRAAKTKARATFALSVDRKPRVRPPPRDRSVINASLKVAEHVNSLPLGAAPRMISPPGGRHATSIPSPGTVGLNPVDSSSGIDVQAPAMTLSDGFVDFHRLEINHKPASPAEVHQNETCSSPNPSDHGTDADAEGEDDNEVEESSVRIGGALL